MKINYYLKNFTNLNETQTFLLFNLTHLESRMSWNLFAKLSLVHLLMPLFLFLIISKNHQEALRACRNLKTKVFFCINWYWRFSQPYEY